MVKVSLLYTVCNIKLEEHLVLDNSFRTPFDKNTGEDTVVTALL